MVGSRIKGHRVSPSSRLWRPKSKAWASASPVASGTRHGRFALPLAAKPRARCGVQTGLGRPKLQQNLQLAQKFDILARRLPIACFVHKLWRAAGREDAFHTSTKQTALVQEP